MIRQSIDVSTQGLPSPERFAAPADGYAALASRLARWTPSTATTTKAAATRTDAEAADVRLAMVVGVTSCLPEEGVTTTIGHLVDAAALAFPRGVLVVSAEASGSARENRNGAKADIAKADIAQPA